MSTQDRTTGDDPDGLRLVVDPADGAPPFEQLRRQVVEHVESGRLAPGDRLPTVRGLADRLGLAAGTVARAYKELEADGVVQTHGRAGTTVAASAERAQAAVRGAADALVRTARAVDVADDEVVAAVRAALGRNPRR